MSGKPTVKTFVGIGLFAIMILVAAAWLKAYRTEQHEKEVIEQGDRIHEIFEDFEERHLPQQKPAGEPTKMPWE